MWDAQDSVDEVHDKYTKEKQELTTCFDEVLPFLLESFWIWIYDLIYCNLEYCYLNRWNQVTCF